MKNTFIKFIGLLILVSIIGSSCKSPKDVRGRKKTKVGMGWM
jgi:hypothetical protein